MTPTSLLKLEDVRAEILSRIAPLPPETVDLFAAAGRFLAQDVVAQEPIPPFDNTAMDGFALRFEDTLSSTPESPVSLQVIATVAAGAAELPRVEAGQAVRIYTGAPIPPGCDSVVPFENTVGFDDEQVQVGEPVTAGAAVRRAGSDVVPGTTVLRRQERLTPAAIGLLATVGVANASVGRRPRVAVHSSGDELVPVEEALTPGKIRNSNLYSLVARLRAWGAEPLPRPVLRDTPEAIRSGLLETLELQPDAIITTGGVSAGDLDYIREVARELGTDVQVRRVNMKPGKPLVDGLLGETPFFGLPGNPAACLVSFEIFVRPVLAILEGRNDGELPRRIARLPEGMTLPGGGRRQFIRARAEFDPNTGEYVLKPLAGQSSHMLTTFRDANCLLEIASPEEAPAKTDRVEIRLLD